jgi:NAD+ synthase
MIKKPVELVALICDQIKKLTDIAILGMSGGADSTLVACLCKQALGSENVYGVHMPYSDIDYRTFNCVSRRISAKLGIENLDAPIEPIVDALNHVISKAILPEFYGKIPAANARARARMCVLYGAANGLSLRFHTKRVRVMGTGNLSEDFIGYDTKGGDALADMFPIGQLFKSEVYELLGHFRETNVISEDMINRTPSAGLWEGQTDERELGHTYEQMETSIRKFIDARPMTDGGVDKFVIDRHTANKHKHEAPLVFDIRKHEDLIN